MIPPAFDPIMKLIAVQFVMLVTLSSATRTGRIEPELDPVSDKKFFTKDYPDDARTPVMHKFGHPYPTVQDSDRYDKDYVEDSNDDNGYWSAQMRYDTAKMNLLKQKKQLEEALKQLQKEEEDVKKAKAAEAAAEKKAEAKEAAQHASDKKHDSAEDALDASKTDVENAAEEVEKEVTDIEECKKQLEAARKKLKKLLEEKAEFEKREKERKEAEAKAEAEKLAAEKREEELEKKIKEEEGEHHEALKSYEEELKDVERVTKELNEAAERLRKFRRADPDGGVYEVKAKGAAWSSMLSGLVILLGVLCFA